MPFCSNCGNEHQPSVNFCNACGAALSNTPGVEREVETDIGWGMAQELRYHISLKRVLIMTVLSYGLYLFYWFYITWKQYRDHTGADAYPVWHALTLLVPFYNLFRIHAHMHSLKELMLNANLSSSISPGWAVLLALVAYMSFQIGERYTEFATLTQGMAIAGAFLEIIGIALVSGLLFHVQGNLNRYWDRLTNGGVTSARIGMGEVTFGIIGALLWLNTLANIFSESWRIGL